MIKQFGNPHFLREPSLSTNSLNSEQYFHDSPLCPNFKYEKLILRNLSEILFR